MIEREWIEQTLLVFLDFSKPPCIGIPSTSREFIAMRLHTPFGLTGGARGVKDASGRVAIRLHMLF